MRSRAKKRKSQALLRNANKICNEIYLTPVIMAMSKKIYKQ